jgi:type IV secretion system protein VirB11
MDRGNAKLAVEATMKNAGLFDLLFDATLTEIMVNPDGKLWVDRVGKGMEDTGRKIPSEHVEAIIRCVASYNHTVCHENLPLLEADLIDFGYARFQGVLPPVTLAPAISIRRKAILNYSLDELCQKKGMLTQVQVTIIRKAVTEKKNIIISGGTNTGKTTLANAILKEFPDSDRVVTLEDTMELETSIIRNCFPLRTMNGTISMDALLRTALRLRPDRILIGEVRGKECWCLLKTFASGDSCSGGLCTIHSWGGKRTLVRLEQLVLEASIKEVPRELIGEVIDLDIHLKKDAKTGKRWVDTIFSINGYRDGEYEVEAIG